MIFTFAVINLKYISISSYVYPIGNGEFRTGHRSDNNKENDEKDKKKEKKSVSLKDKDDKKQDSVWSKPKYDEKKYGNYIDFVNGKEKDPLYSNYSLFDIPTDNYEDMQDWILDKIIEHEGGYSDRASDKGGKTKWGIAWNTWKNYAKSTLGIEPTEDNLRNLSVDDAKQIYINNFWKPARIDDIENVDMKYAFFDFYINAPVRSVKTMQAVLNEKFGEKLDVDGALGSKTINAINSVEHQKLYNEFIDARSGSYNRIVEIDSTQKANIRGWQNRVDKFRINNYD